MATLKIQTTERFIKIAENLAKESGLSLDDYIKVLISDDLLKSKRKNSKNK